MSDETSDIVQKTLENLGYLKDKIPKAVHGFSDLNKASLQDGCFDKRTKEIIVLAIAIAVYSKGCMKFHLQSLIKQQLSQDELIEITAIITYICGGSGLMSSLKALKYYNEMQKSNNSSGAEKSSGEDVASHERSSFHDNIIKGYE
jgi:alkylhydroperoxidase/carboxymuconolactone decarboxylase family protein YurZ